MVQGGKFQLFNDDPRTPDTMNLTYNFIASCPDGRKMHFNGYKVVNSGVVCSPINLWKATTTLYCTVSEIKDDKVGETVGRGMIYIRIAPFLQEVSTMEATGSTAAARLWSTTSFLSYFTKKAASAFLSPFAALRWPNLPFQNYENSTQWSEEYALEASDHCKTKMYMWSPMNTNQYDQRGDSAPIILFVPGASVDQQIFALPTIEHNAVNYFRTRGYRVYCLVHRVGRIPVAKQNWTTYDARRDITAALEKIRSIHGIEDRANGTGPTQTLYVVSHCAGAVALASGLLDGTIPRQWISGVTASQVFMNPQFAKVNFLKANLRPSLSLVYKLLQGSWFDCSSSPQAGYIQQAMNQALRFYPVGPRDEICNSVVCHRSSLVFGR
jgi:hypothetical protein